VTVKKDGYKKAGLIFGGLFALCDKLSKLFRSGFIFRLLSSGEEDGEARSNSAISECFDHVSKKTRKATENVKKFTARQFERSALLKLISAFNSALLNIQGRVIGAFGVTWASYVIVIQLIKRFALPEASLSFTDISAGAVTFIASIPLLFTEKSLISMAEESVMVSLFLNKVFGIPFESFRSNLRIKVGQSVAVILGILLGLLTYYVSPLHMILVIATLFSMGLIFSYPEGGVLLTVALAPFAGAFSHPSIILAIFVLLTAASYFVKVLRGKRVFKVGGEGFATYSFLLVVFLSGFAPGQAHTFENAILCCSLMLIYPLVTNLMKNRHWINACAAAFIIPSAVVAFIGIAEYMLGVAPSGWVDVSLYPDITQRAVSLFQNPNVLGTYLAALFPMSIMLMLPKFPTKVRILGVISTAYIAVAAALTFSRSAWIAIFAGAIIFAVMVSPRGLLLILPAAVAVVSIALIFPDTVGIRLLNFISQSDSANNYRLAVWNSSWDLLSDTFIHGIGWGEEAFRTAYINYAAEGTQSVMHSHSLYLQIAIQTGVIGLVLFIASVLLIVKKSIFSTSVRSSDASLALFVKAAISGALSVMIIGIFDYTWYNFRVFFIFWALLAFASAAVKVIESETIVHLQTYDETYSFVTVGIPKPEEKSETSKANKEKSK
jgi:O-antigen ligase